MRGLTLAGLGATALGRLESLPPSGPARPSAPRLVLTGCIALSDHARAQLPHALGGENMGFAASPSTLDLVSRASPRPRGADGSPAFPPRSLFSTPGRLSPTGPAPSSAERRRLCQAVAAALEVASSARAQADEAMAVEADARAAQRAASAIAADHAVRRSSRLTSRAAASAAAPPTESSGLPTAATRRSRSSSALPSSREGDGGGEAEGEAEGAGRGGGERGGGEGGRWRSRRPLGPLRGGRGLRQGAPRGPGDPLRAPRGALGPRGHAHGRRRPLRRGGGRSRRRAGRRRR